jgi:hypothetical protein
MITELSAAIKVQLLLDHTVSHIFHAQESVSDTVSPNSEILLHLIAAAAGLLCSGVKRTRGGDREEERNLCVCVHVHACICVSACVHAHALLLIFP